MSRHAVDKAPFPSVSLRTAGYLVLAEGSTRSLLPCDFGAILMPKLQPGNSTNQIGSKIGAGRACTLDPKS